MADDLSGVTVPCTRCNGERWLTSTSRDGMVARRYPCPYCRKAVREAEIHKQITAIQAKAQELEAESNPFNDPHLEFLEGWYWELKEELQNA